MSNESEIKLNLLFSEEQMPLLPTDSLVIPFKKGSSIPLHLTYSEINDGIFKTVNEETNEKEDEDENEDLIVLAQVIEDFYDNVSATTSEEAFKQGFQAGKRVIHQTSPIALHLAVRKGDTDTAEITKLINQGDSVNAADHLSIPLHVATFFGKTEADASNSLEDLSAKGTQLAIHKAFYDMTEALIPQDNPNQLNANNELPVNTPVDRFISKIKNQEVAEQISKTILEFDKMYDYELLAKINAIAMPEQKYDNSTWESYRDAIEGMILTELLNLNAPPNTTRDTVYQYFQEWDRFQAHYPLKEYFSEDAVLPEKALIDIFSEIHQREYDKLSEYEKTDAKMIIDALVSPTYDTKFKHWLTNNFSENGNQLKALFSNYGLDVMENGNSSGKPTKIPFSEVIAQFKAFYQDPETTNLQETTVPAEVISLHSGISTTPTLSHLEVVTEVF